MIVEVVIIIFKLPIVPMQNAYDPLPFVNNIYAASINSADEGSDKYLSSLDSDTKDYVLKHTDKARSKADVINCINELHEKG